MKKVYTVVKVVDGLVSKVSVFTDSKKAWNAAVNMASWLKLDSEELSRGIQAMELDGYIWDSFGNAVEIREANLVE